MVQTRARSSRNMEERILVLEEQMQKLNKVDKLQDTVFGFRDELKALVLATQANNGDQGWLRQLGSMKEYNEFFDDAVTRFQLQMPKEYHVVAYVDGLKDEIHDSVELFQPRTMREARSIARAEELFLQWRLKKARRVLKDKEDDGYPSMTPPKVQEASAFQEKVEFCADATQGCFEVQESSRVSKQLPKNSRHVLGVHHGLKMMPQDDEEVTKLLDIQKQKELESHNDGFIGNSH